MRLVSSDRFGSAHVSLADINRFAAASWIARADGVSASPIRAPARGESGPNTAAGAVAGACAELLPAELSHTVAGLDAVPVSDKAEAEEEAGCFLGCGMELG